jgi:hypothetical protein
MSDGLQVNSATDEGPTIMEVGLINALRLSKAHQINPRAALVIAIMMDGSGYPYEDMAPVAFKLIAHLHEWSQIVENEDFESASGHTASLFVRGTMMAVKSHYGPEMAQALIEASGVSANVYTVERG